MFVTEHISRARNPIFSYEIIPPPRGRGARDILDIVELLLPFEPPFIDVTAHGAIAQYEEQPDGTVRRRIRLKRPGTISLCGIIQNRYNVDTVPHLLCRGFSREETEDAMIELNFLGIHNVLAVRGDESVSQRASDSDRTVNKYAGRLVKQLDDLRSGNYLEEIADSEPIEMCIGVGGYPEKHVEAVNPKDDLRRLKEKVDAGADYVVTQMFFDNQKFFDFERGCREIGIEVPIIPGLKVINNAKQLTKLAKNFHVDIPSELVDQIHAEPKKAREIGIDWAVKQSTELINRGNKCIHYFVVNDAPSVVETVGRLR